MILPWKSIINFAVIPSIDLTISSGRRTSICLLRSKWMSEKVVIENLIRTTASPPSVRYVEGIAANISPLRQGHGCALTEGELTSK